MKAREMIKRGQMGGKAKTRFLLYDDFGVPLGAGEVNGSYATDGVNLRNVTDTNGKLSIADGALTMASGGVGAGDPGLWYGIQTRVAGLALLFMMKATANAMHGGLDNNNSGTSNDAVQFNGAVATVRPASVAAAAITGGGEYWVGLISRVNGCFYYIKGGAYANWRKLYPYKTGNANFYASLIAGGATSAGTFKKVRIPENRIVVPPLASDAFTRADGAPGMTGGGGSEEAGGSGLTWTNQVGTTAISGNKLMATVLVGGIAIVTCPVAYADVLVEAALTRGTTGVGIVLRYQDAQNYIYSRRVATNIELHKVTTAGGDATVLTTSAAETNGSRLVASAFGTKIRQFYKDLVVGAEQTISDASLQSSLNMGLIFFDTDSSADDFVVWDAQSASEGAELDKYTGVFF